MSKVAMMIHGFLTDKNDFGKLTELVSDRYDEIFLCEIPGHNESKDYSEFTVDATIEYVTEHFNRLKEKYDEIDLYGYSMGGALCTYLASMGGVSNMLLFAPANKYLNPSYLMSGFALYYRKIRETIASAPKETKAKERAKDIEKALDIYLQNSKTSMDIAVKRLVPYYNKHTLLTFTRLVKKINASLKVWDTRTCIFWGKLDQMVPLSSIEFLSDYYIDAEHYVKIYEDYSHLMLNSKNAEPLLRDVMKFLNGEDEFCDSKKKKAERKAHAKENQERREAHASEPWFRQIANDTLAKVAEMHSEYNKKHQTSAEKQNGTNEVEIVKSRDIKITKKGKQD